MALQGEQRALLKLVCERDQSYEDISGLLGLPTEEVRWRARAALRELGGEDPDAEVGLTDYLLGQADPIGRADAVRYMQSDPEALALAQRIEERLLEIAPAANLPRLPEPRGKRRRAAAPPAGERLEPEPPRSRSVPRAGKATASPASEKAPRSGLDARQSQILAGLAALAVILLFAILALAGAFSGSDDAATPATAGDGTTTAGDGTTAPNQPENSITTVDLRPTGGSTVAGTARFGVVGGQQLYVDLAIQGLDPSPPRDSVYFVWLMVGEKAGYPVNSPNDSPIIPRKDGSWSGRIAVPAPVAQAVAARASSVRISSSPLPELAAAVRESQKQNVPIVRFVGTELASGKIPLAQPAAGEG